MTTMISEVFDAVIERRSDLVALRAGLAANTTRLAGIDGKVTVLLAVNGLMLAAALAGIGKVLLAH